MPYIYKTAVEASTTGVPTMRSMVMEFEKDRTCPYLDKQYMFGDSLLVAPIFNDEGLGSFYLPSGKWTDFFTGEVYEGEKWYEKKYDYLHLPLMVKENSIIVLGSCDNKPDYDYEKDVEVRIYAPEEGKEIKTDVYGMDGKVKMTVKAVKKGNEIIVTKEGTGTIAKVTVPEGLVAKLA